MKIISTVPSQTELLFDLNLEDEVVGITKFCIHPSQWFKSKERIGGTKTLNIEKITSLKPDLIIANKEENTKEQVNILANYTDVFVSDVKTIEDNYALIKKVGELTNKETEAQNLITKTKQALEFVTIKKDRTAIYLIWNQPLMTIGSDTFIHCVLEKCGFKNLFSSQKRYPKTTIEEIAKLNPEYVLLSSEPFPFKDKHCQELKKELPNTQVMLVDGEAFSWYGSRIFKKAHYLKKMTLI